MIRRVGLLLCAALFLVGGFGIYKAVSAYQRLARIEAGVVARRGAEAALLEIEHSIRQANNGFGSVPIEVMGCTVRGSGREPEYAMLPLQIVPGRAPGEPVSLEVLVTNAGGPARAGPQADPSGPFRTASGGRPDLRDGDVAVAALGSDGVPGSASCRQLQVGAGQTAPGTLYGLGAAPMLQRWQVGTAGLQRTDRFGGNAAHEPAAGIVDLQAEYGVDSNDDHIISPSEWASTPPLDWRQLRAVRIALLLRTESENTSDPVIRAGTPESQAPRWMGGNFRLPAVDNAADPLSTGYMARNNAHPYRYTVLEKLIPLRNVIQQAAR